MHAQSEVGIGNRNMKTGHYDLIWNNESSEHSVALARLFENARHVDVAVAFAKMSGWGHIKDHLLHHLEQGRSARFIIGLNFYQSEPTLLKLLLQLSRKHSLSVFVGDKLDGVFHPKVYRFEYVNKSVSMLIGSANWTNGGMADNYECSVLLRLNSETKIRNRLDELCKDERVSALTPCILRDYSRRYDIARAARATEQRRLKRLRTAKPTTFAVLRELLREFRLDKSEQGFDVQVRNRAEAVERASKIMKLIATARPTGERFDDLLRKLDASFHSAIVPIFMKSIAGEPAAFAELCTRALASGDLSPEQAFEKVREVSIRGVGPNWRTEMLHSVNPSKFAVLNRNSSAGMRLAGPEFPERPSNNNITPQTYAQFCLDARRVAAELGLRNLSELDAVFNEAYWQDQDE